MNDHYRDPDLTDDEALDLMEDAASSMARMARSTRFNLLDHGFADKHEMCRDLDITDRQWTSVVAAVRRMRHQIVTACLMLAFHSFDPYMAWD